NDREVEHGPALSLWLGKWSRPVQAEPFHINLEPTPDGHSLLGWPDGLLDADRAQSVLLVLGDPMSFPVDLFLNEINSTHPGLRVLGGMASGMIERKESRLLLNDQVVSSGAVGVLLQGPTGLRSIVSQGCRPIGRHMLITRGEENIIA